MDVCEDIRAQGISSLMSPEVLCVYEGWSVSRLAKFLADRQIGGAPVIASDHSLVGVVSVTDILRFQKLEGDDKQNLVENAAYVESLGQKMAPEALMKILEHADEYVTVNAIMTPHVISVPRQATIGEVSRIMVAENVRRVFVTEDDKVVGVVTAGNLLTSLC